MKRQKFKYPGDAAFQRLLEKHGCPTPFHVVRMRFLGEIASLDFGASPIKTVESFWDGELPLFEREGEASIFFQTMMSLWTRMARHQEGVLVKLQKTKKLRDWDDVSAALRMRAEELRDGFLVGFSGSGNAQPVPQHLEDALHGLEKAAEQFELVAERVNGPERGEDGLTVDDYRGLLEVHTREAEALLTAIMHVSKVIRSPVIEAGSEFGDGMPIP